MWNARSARLSRANGSPPLDYKIFFVKKKEEEEDKNVPLFRVRKRGDEEEEEEEQTFSSVASGPILSLSLTLSAP